MKNTHLFSRVIIVITKYKLPNKIIVLTNNYVSARKNNNYDSRLSNYQYHNYFMQRTNTIN